MSNAVNTSVFRGRPLEGRLTRSVAGNTSVTLSTAEAMYGIIELTGALTGNINVVFPDIDGLFWQVFNNTTGDYTITLKVGTATGIKAPQGKKQFVYSDGTDIRDAVRRTGYGVQTIKLVAADVTLTTAEAATGFIQLTDNSVGADFSLIFPAYSMLIGDMAWVRNELAYNCTVKFGSGDTGVVVPASTEAMIVMNLTGAAHFGLPNDTSTGHRLVGALFGGTNKGGLQLGVASYPVTATATQTLDATVYSAPIVHLTGTPGAGKTIVFPANAGSLWIVDNATGFTQVLKIVGDGGSGISVANSRRAIVVAGATAMERVTADAVLT